MAEKQISLMLTAFFQDCDLLGVYTSDGVQNIWYPGLFLSILVVRTESLVVLYILFFVSNTILDLVISFQVSNICRPLRIGRFVPNTFQISSIHSYFYHLFNPLRIGRFEFKQVVGHELMKSLCSSTCTKVAASRHLGKNVNQLFL